MRVEVLSHPLTMGLEQPRIPPPRPLLAERLRSVGDWRGYPRYTGWLGWCDDGLPMLYELPRHDLQAVLFMVESAAQGFPFLNTLVGSLTWFNEPRQVQLYIISRRPVEDWWGLVHRNPGHQDQTPEGFRLLQDWGQPVTHIRVYAAPGTYAADEAIIHLAGLVEQRSFGRHNREGILLVLDDLRQCWLSMGDDARHQLPIVLTQGGRWKIGTVAWMTYADALRGDVPAAIRSAFGWRALGALYDRGIITALRAQGTAVEQLRTLHADEAIIQADAPGKMLPFWPLRV